MEIVFFVIFNRSISAGWLIAAVLAARFLLKKAPKKIICMMWLVVGLRLICPFDIVSSFSLLPEKGTGHFLDSSVAVPDGKAAFQQLRVPAQKIQTADTDQPVSWDTGRFSGFIDAAPYVWLTGMFFMAAYLVFSWMYVKKKTAAAVPAEYEGIGFYFCENIASPFLFGLVKPKIYVPFSVPGQELSYVLMHEKAHKSRCDHWVKAAGYLLLSCFWFHPLVWAAYILMCRDIELACDEKVITELGGSCKKAYSAALLSCAVNGRKTMVYPVAFGEAGVKNRVKNILNYKKPKLWGSLAAAAVCVIVTVCFATEAKSREVQTAQTGTSVQKHDKTVQETGDQTAAQRTEGVSQKPDEGISQKPDEEISQKPDEGISRKSDEGVSWKSDEMNQAASDLASGHLTKWAEAFCSRDADAITKMTDTMGKQALTDAGLLDGTRSFGWSSPWPWQTDSGSPNYRIISADGQTAEVLYYAWTSDPHVTVWRQALAYHYEKETDTFLVNGFAMAVLDSISSAEEFYAAYPGGSINGTPMDYVHGNDAGEDLNFHTMVSNTNIARSLYMDPAAAACYLLNIEDDESKVTAQTAMQGGEAVVTFTFLEDGGTASVKMIRMSGEYSIWVPQTADENG